MIHFRFRANEIEVCRLVVSAKTGKRQRLVLGVISSSGILSDELRSNCKQEDLVEIGRRLAHYARTDRLQAELVARILPEQILRAHLWLSELDSREQIQDLAEDIRASWQRLRRTLKERDLI